MLKIGLLFHGACSDNLGVGALTQAQIEVLRAVAQATGIEMSFTIFDWVSERRPYVVGPDIEHQVISPDLMRSPRHMISLFKMCDLIVDIGAGDSFADTYGKPRLRRMIYLKYLAQLSGRPTVLAPQTIGPFGSLLYRMVVRDLVGRATLVATRDETSTGHLRKLGVRRSVLTSSDVAFCLKPNGPVPTWVKPSFGLNISGLLLAGGYDGKNQFALQGSYLEAMQAVLSGALALPSAPQITLVPHVICPQNEQEDDLAACLRLQRQFPQVGVAPAFTSPGQAKAYISSFDFFAGARMHACVAALSSGVPVVPIAYSGKFAGLFGGLGYDAIADCRSLSAQQVADSVLSGFARRAELKKQVTSASENGQERLGAYADALSRVISDIALRKRALEKSVYDNGPQWRAMDERL